MDIKEFSNEHFNLKVLIHPGCRIIFEITISPEQLQKEYAKALRSIGKEVSIPGFRKGKAPLHMLEKNFNTNIISEWKSILLEKGFSESMKLSDIYPINNESIKKTKFNSLDKEKGAEISIEFECHPIIPDFDFSSIEVSEQKPKETTEEDVQKRIENYCSDLAEWKILEDRIIQDKDLVVVNIDNIEEEEQKSIYKEFPIEINKDKIGEWLYNLVIGTKKGDVVEGTSTLDEKASDEVKETFKPTKCRITIVNIFERIIPDIDEALLKKLRFDSKEDMLKKTHSELENEAKRNSEDALKQNVTKEILEKCKFDLPASEVESQRQLRIKSKIQDLNKKGLSKDKVLEMKEQIELDVSKEIDSDLHMNYVYGQIISKEKIEVSNKEITEKLPQYQAMYNFYYGKSEQPKNMKIHVENDILIGKIWDYLLKTVKINKKD